MASSGVTDRQLLQAREETDALQSMLEIANKFAHKVSQFKSILGSPETQHSTPRKVPCVRCCTSF